MRYNTTTDYLTYLGFLHGIPRSWKHNLQNIDIATGNQTLNKYQELRYTKKICRFIYNKMIQHVLETPNRIIQLWQAELHGRTTDEDIYEAFGHLYTITPATKYQVFQFKILHRILVTNEDLYKWKIKETDLCTFCQEEIETIVHLFLECEVIKQFWLQIEEWLYQINNTRIHIQPIEIILGKINIENKLYDLIYLACKHYIYSCRCTHTFPTLRDCVNKIRQLYELEKQIAIKHDNIQYFDLKWGNLQWDI